MAYIKAVSYYLPETILTNEELSNIFPEWSVEKVADKIGIKERHISSKDEFCSDMAVKAAEKLFQEHKIDRSTIDFILLCTQSPDYFLPTTACIVQDRLGISTQCGALDFNQGCSGYVYGLALAKGLIASGVATNILLITSESYSKFIHPKDKGNRTIFGDAASASLISTDGFAEINDLVLGTDGRGANNLIVKNGGLRNPQKEIPIEDLQEDGELNLDNHLYMNGTEIFNFTLESVPNLVNQTLLKNNVNHDEISYFVFHQANKYMLNHLRKKIGIPEEKFVYYMESCGNTVSSTIPIVLNNLINGNSLDKESKILLAGFGVGYSWGGCILTIK